ncbi:MAG: FUSC family protein, partial [Chlamydiae bacterium]|nr:FUSC family protein [Chlamydiota bacterium]
MQKIEWSSYFIESCKVTVFCLCVTLFYYFFGCSDTTLLVSFYMSVMSAASTFSIKAKHFNQVFLGGVMIATAINCGGVLGYYFPVFSKAIAIVYAGLAFFLPKKRYQSDIFVTSAVTYLVFTVTPFPLQEGIKHSIECVFVFMVFVFFYFLFDYPRAKNVEIVFDNNDRKVNKITAAIAVGSLSIAWFISYLITMNHNYPRIFWMELTALVVVAGSQQDTILTSIKRITACTLAAAFVLLLFDYILPHNFFLSFLMLVIFLFFIFFLSFSYFLKVLFIEMFVVSITYLLGNRDDLIAIARVALTAAGGAVVILVTS